MPLLQGSCDYCLRVSLVQKVPGGGLWCGNCDRDNPARCPWWFPAFFVGVLGVPLVVWAVTNLR